MRMIKSLFSAEKGSISSKRVIGVIGYIVVLVLYTYCTINQIQMPNITSDIIFALTALLGVDSVTKIWRKEE